jgi:hypothetical protein
MVFPPGRGFARQRLENISVLLTADMSAISH